MIRESEARLTLRTDVLILLNIRVCGIWIAEAQRAMIVSPDAHAFIRPHAKVKAREILERNSRVHFNIDLRFNSHSLLVAFTEQEAIGVDSMPNIVFKEKQIYDYVWGLWSNSTLGLLCYLVNLW